MLSEFKSTPLDMPDGLFEACQAILGCIHDAQASGYVAVSSQYIAQWVGQSETGGRSNTILWMFFDSGYVHAHDCLIDGYHHTCWNTTGDNPTCANEVLMS